MWMVIHMAKTVALAQTFRERLEREGFLVKLHPVNRATSDEIHYVELLVPELEAAEAFEVLQESGLR